MKSTVYYDYYDGIKAPKWFVLYLGYGNINWQDEFIYLPIEAPFEIHAVEDFDNGIISATVTMGDMIRNEEKPNELGIYLPRLKQAIFEFGSDPNEVSQFIMLVADIEETLQLNLIRQHLEW